MASSAILWLVFGIVIFSAIHQSHQIKCYSCIDGQANKKKSPREDLPHLPEIFPTNRCSEELSEAEAVVCPVTSTSCYKIDGTLSGANVELTGTTRMCGDPMLQEACSLIGEKKVTVAVICNACETDGCNSAASATIAVTLLIATALFTKLYQ